MTPQFAIGLVMSIASVLWNPWMLILVTLSYGRLAFLKIAKNHSSFINIAYLIITLGVIVFSPVALAVLTHSAMYLIFTGISFAFILKSIIKPTNLITEILPS